MHEKIMVVTEHADCALRILKARCAARSGKESLRRAEDSGEEAEMLGPDVHRQSRPQEIEPRKALIHIFGIDRAANPWDDIPLAEVLLIAGANCAETFPVLNKFLWQQRDNGGRWIIVDPRETPTARQGDLHLQLKPGTDVAVANGILHVLIKENLVDEEFINARTNGWDETKAVAERFTPAVAAEISGVPAERIVRAALLYGRAKTGMLMHARGIEHHTNGVNNVLSYINIVLATGKIGKPGSGYGTITGQGNGQGGREHGQKADQLPGQRSMLNPEHRKHVCRVWGLPEEEIVSVAMSRHQADNVSQTAGLML